MEKNKQKQGNILYRVLWAYREWLISTQARCDCEWSQCLKKIFNNNNAKEVGKLRQFLEAQSQYPMEDRNPFDPDLQFLVGVAYLSGWFPCKNSVEEAQRWFRRSASQDSPRGKMGIGYLHEKRLVEYHDEIAMLSNYSFAAARHYAPAQYRLAQYYHRQTNPNRVQIRDLLTDSAIQQYEPAKYMLAELYPETIHDVEYREIYGDDWAALARMQKESGTGLYAPAERTTKDYLLEILETLQRVVHALMILQSSLNSMWAELREADAENSDKLDILQQQMNKTLQKAVSVEFAPVTHKAIEDAEAFMSVLFKGDWRNSARLCDASCDALVTAYVLMKVADMLEIRNYSGIVITAVWALEHECRRRFRDAFDSYLVSMDVPKEERVFRMNLQKLGKDGHPEYSLGSIKYVVKAPDFEAFSKATNLLSPAAERERVKKGYSDGQMIWGYWLPGTWDPISKNGKTFQSILITLNQDYRIPAAHAEEVGREKAEECCDLLGITEAHKKMDSIAGALKALLWLTAPLE